MEIPGRGSCLASDARICFDVGPGVTRRRCSRRRWRRWRRRAGWGGRHAQVGRGERGGGVEAEEPGRAGGSQSVGVGQSEVGVGRDRRRVHPVIRCEHADPAVGIAKRGREIGEDRGSAGLVERSLVGPPELGDVDWHRLRAQGIERLPERGDPGLEIVWRDHVGMKPEAIDVASQAGIVGEHLSHEAVRLSVPVGQPADDHDCVRVLGADRRARLHVQVGVQTRIGPGVPVPVAVLLVPDLVDVDRVVGQLRVLAPEGPAGAVARREPSNEGGVLADIRGGGCRCARPDRGPRPPRAGSSRASAATRCGAVRPRPSTGRSIPSDRSAPAHSAHRARPSPKAHPRAPASHRSMPSTPAEDRADLAAADRRATCSSPRRHRRGLPAHASRR